jgi:hypothetical protein
MVTQTAEHTSPPRASTLHVADIAQVLDELAGLTLEDFAELIWRD